MDQIPRIILRHAPRSEEGATLNPEEGEVGTRCRERGRSDQQLEQHRPVGPQIGGVIDPALHVAPLGPGLGHHVVADALDHLRGHEVGGTDELGTVQVAPHHILAGAKVQHDNVAILVQEAVLWEFREEKEIN